MATEKMFPARLMVPSAAGALTFFIVSENNDSDGLGSYVISIGAGLLVWVVIAFIWQRFDKRADD